LVFPAEQAPAFVLVDAGMHLLAELDQVQTQAQWLAQLHGSARAIDRIRAGKALASFPSSVAIVDPLWRAAAHDRFHAVRTAAATALGTLGDAQAQAALLVVWVSESDLLARGDSDPRVRKAVLDALTEAKAPIEADHFD